MDRKRQRHNNPHHNHRNKLLHSPEVCIEGTLCSRCHCRKAKFTANSGDTVYGTIMATIYLEMFQIQLHQHHRRRTICARAHRRQCFVIRSQCRCQCPIRWASRARFHRRCWAYTTHTVVSFPFFSITRTTHAWEPSEKYCCGC